MPKIPPVAVHDHFDGASHCVECEGPCHLTGAEYHLSELVRMVLISNVRTGAGLSTAEVGAMQDAGVDLKRFLVRARQSIGN